MTLVLCYHVDPLRHLLGYPILPYLVSKSIVDQTIRKYHHSILICLIPLSKAGRCSLEADYFPTRKKPGFYELSSWNDQTAQNHPDNGREAGTPITGLFSPGI